ncbi:hypothetical protein [Actinoplanes sp. NPDC051851]|uniref:hypothetical protein n=1 Tax=Actinoplanes sp. NPDC051851 TaxID=3154753 RepID=UPI00343E84AF
MALLTVAVCAVLAGATSFAAIIDWLYDLDEPGRVRLGFTRGVPAGTRPATPLPHGDRSRR